MTQQLTPNFQLPYYQGTDVADGAAQQQALATRLDLVLAASARPATALPVLDVGMTGQVRAGRQLALADFTDLGLSAPAGLWNLSNLTDASGNGRTLTNKGAVPFDTGINGTAATAARFTGSTAQALYIADTGAADPFRIKTGSWGCWFRTAKRSTLQDLVTKESSTNQRVFSLAIGATTNVVASDRTVDGSTGSGASGVTDVCDDRWHFAIGTYDGTVLRIYVDGMLEGTSTVLTGPMFSGSGPLNIGARYADGSTAATNPNYGRVDEAFVTPDVLTEDQIRVLYAARIAHTLGTVPRSASLSVNRRRKGAPLAPADFTTTPLRLYNFSFNGDSTTGWADQGSNGVALTPSGNIYACAAADGSGSGPNQGQAIGMVASGNGQAMATDAGLPAALTARSYGCWFKTLQTTPSQTVLAWGTVNTGDSRVGLATGGTLFSTSGADNIGVTPPTPFVADGQWHQVIVTEDNAAADGVRRKLYLDGRLVGISTVMNSTVLVGANSFRVGATSTGTNPITGQIDGAFVTGYALTAADIATLYAKGSQGLGASPKNAGDHVERMDATAVYFVGDTLDSQHTIDLGVAS
jgi:hypothetical protein